MPHGAPRTPCPAMKSDAGVLVLAPTPESQNFARSASTTLGFWRVRAPSLICRAIGHESGRELAQATMQLTTLFTTVAVLAMASCGMAACDYQKADYASACASGEKNYCTGNVGICPKRLKESFDATAIKANQDACAGLNVGAHCMQTACCS
ncbi:hypothetical protein JHW43_000497 [Diplocarpon mali]|nr:hypothetical protein JHW43_000497 [Diplocarpon mali]